MTDRTPPIGRASHDAAFSDGDRVVIKTDDHYNGKRGVVIGFEAEQDLPWLVRLDGIPHGNPFSFAGEELESDAS